MWRSLTGARRAREVSNVGHRGEGTEMTVGYHSKTSRQLFPQTFYSSRGKPPIHRNVHTYDVAQARSRHARTKCDGNFLPPEQNPKCPVCIAGTSQTTHNRRCKKKEKKAPGDNSKCRSQAKGGLLSSPIFFSNATKVIIVKIKQNSIV